MNLSHHLTSDSYLHSFLSHHSGHGKHSLLCSSTSQSKQAETISSSRSSKAHEANLPNFLSPLTATPCLSPWLGSILSSSFGKTHHILLGATEGKHILSRLTQVVFSFCNLFHLFELDLEQQNHMWLAWHLIVRTSHTPKFLPFVCSTTYLVMDKLGKVSGKGEREEKITS